MSRSSEQKIKLLILYDLLQKNTDEEHLMTTNEITEALKNLGVVVTRKTLYDDIATLNRYGFEFSAIRAEVTFIMSATANLKGIIM